MSILGHLLLNLFIKELERRFKSLEKDINTVLSWFKITSLKPNPIKIQFMALGTKENDYLVLNIDKKKIESSTKVTFLGIKIDRKLKLRVLSWSKPHALRRVRKYLTVEKAQLLANTFTNSQFSYALLIWMFTVKPSITEMWK